MRGRESWNGLFFSLCLLSRLGFVSVLGRLIGFLGGGGCRILFLFLCVDHSLVGRPVFFFRFLV